MRAEGQRRRELQRVAKLFGQVERLLQGRKRSRRVAALNRGDAEVVQRDRYAFRVLEPAPDVECVARELLRFDSVSSQQRKGPCIRQHRREGGLVVQRPCELERGVVVAARARLVAFGLRNVAEPIERARNTRVVVDRAKELEALPCARGGGRQIAGDERELAEGSGCSRTEDDRFVRGDRERTFECSQGFSDVSAHEPEAPQPDGEPEATSSVLRCPLESSAAIVVVLLQALEPLGFIWAAELALRRRRDAGVVLQMGVPCGGGLRGLFELLEGVLANRLQQSESRA